MDAVNAFLDAADEVLNSNTFLVEVPLRTGDIWEDVRTFLNSGDLQQVLLEVDMSRGWYTLHYFSDSENAVPFPGTLIRKGFLLREKRPGRKAGDYLEAMLKGDNAVGAFVSFYSCPKSAPDARRLTHDFVAQLFPTGDLTLYILETDFFGDTAGEPQQIHYFENAGCDNAALLVGGSACYLLLTNGMP